MHIHISDIHHQATAERRPCILNPLSLNPTVEQDVKVSVPVLLVFQDSNVRWRMSHEPLQIDAEICPYLVYVLCRNPPPFSFLGIERERKVSLFKPRRCAAWTDSNAIHRRPTWSAPRTVPTLAPNFAIACLLRRCLGLEENPHYAVYAPQLRFQPFGLSRLICISSSEEGTGASRPMEAPPPNPRDKLFHPLPAAGAGL